MPTRIIVFANVLLFWIGLCFLFRFVFGDVFAFVLLIMGFSLWFNVALFKFDYLLGAKWKD
jgi:hypothetical protein